MPQLIWAGDPEESRSAAAIPRPGRLQQPVGAHDPTC
jgi:hypothetical protein